MMIETNKELVLDSDEFYFLGIAYFNNNEFNRAKEALTKADKIKSNPHTKFLLILCDVIPIMNRIGALFTLSETDLILLNNAYRKIIDKEISDFMSKGNPELVIEYWQRRLGITFFIDTKRALDEYLKAPEKIKDNPEIKLLYADILNFNKKDEEGLRIYLELYSEYKKPEILIKIINIYIKRKEYHRVIEYYNSLPIDEYDSHGNVAAALIEIIYEVEGFKVAIEKSTKFLDNFKKPFYLYNSLGIIYAKNKELNKAKDFFIKMVDTIPYDDFPPRARFAEDLINFDFNELAIKCLQPFISYNDKAKKRYIMLLVNSKDIDFLQKGEIILLDELKNDSNNIDWLKLLVDCYYFLNKKYKALEYLEKLFKIEPIPSHAYNLVILKNELGQKGYRDLAPILEKENNPHSVMMAALCHDFEKEFSNAQRLSYRALALIGNSFDESIYTQYLRINFFPHGKGNDDKVELEIITNDSAFELVNENETIWIAIDTDNLIFEGKEIIKFIGAEHFSTSNTTIIQLLNHKLNEEIEFRGNRYIIKQIITTKARAIRYCLEEFLRLRPNSKFLKQIKVNESNPIESMLPQLVELENQQKKMLDDYNFANGIGTPHWILAKYIGRNLFDSISFILNKRDQVYYAGEIPIFEQNNIRFVLSPTTIILLNILGILPRLSLLKEHLSLEESIIQYFVNIIQEITTEEINVQMTIGMLDSKPFINEYSNSHIERRLKFFQEIISVIKDLPHETLQVLPEQLDEHRNIINVISEMEYKTMQLTNEKGYIYIADDLFLRKIYNTTFQTNKSSNLITLLMLIYDEEPEKLISLLLKLSEAKYLFLFNSFILKIIIKYICAQYNILGPGTEYEKIDKLIFNSLSDRRLFNDYEPILLNIISNTYDSMLDNKGEYIIKIILKNLWIYYSLYNIEEIIIYSKLNSISGKDNGKKEFLYMKLNEVKTLKY